MGHERTTTPTPLPLDHLENDDLDTEIPLPLPMELDSPEEIPDGRYLLRDRSSSPPELSPSAAAQLPGSIKTPSPKKASPRRRFKAGNTSPQRLLGPQAKQKKASLMKRVVQYVKPPEKGSPETRAALSRLTHIPSKAEFRRKKLLKGAMDVGEAVGVVVSALAGPENVFINPERAARWSGSVVGEGTPRYDELREQVATVRRAAALNRQLSPSLTSHAYRHITEARHRRGPRNIEEEIAREIDEQMPSPSPWAETVPQSRLERLAPHIYSDPQYSQNHQTDSSSF
jgi:hypothetical protein